MCEAFTTVNRAEADEPDGRSSIGPGADTLADNASISVSGTWGHPPITYVTCGPSPELAHVTRVED